MSLNTFLSHFLSSLWIFSPGFSLPASSLSEHEDLCTNFFKDWPVFPAVALKSDSTEKKIPLMLKIFSCFTRFFIFVAQFTSLLTGPYEHSLFLSLAWVRVTETRLVGPSCHSASSFLFASTQMGVTHSF